MTVAEKGNDPKTFEELLGKKEGPGVKPLPLCSRCGQPATHKLSLTASKARLEKKRGGTMVARHINDLCEGCAVTVYASFRKAIR